LRRSTPISILLISGCAVCLPFLQHYLFSSPAWDCMVYPHLWQKEEQGRLGSEKPWEPGPGKSSPFFPGIP